MESINPRNVIKVLIEEFGPPGSDFSAEEKEMGEHLIGSSEIFGITFKNELIRCHQTINGS